MRQLLIRVARDSNSRVIAAAHKHDAVEVMQWEAKSGDDPVAMIAVHLENRSLGALLDEIEGLPGLSVSFFPAEVLLIQPPKSAVVSEVKELEERSPLEFFLHSIQSIGSWPSFLAYAVAGAIVVWIAFFTDTTYLLVAAMLVSPFAGPAMHVAVATAAGDVVILKKSLVRYIAAVLATMAVTGILTLILQPEIVTNLMVSVSQVSAVAFLLPLTAGAAGALNLVQSNRSSLVSGAAVGMLVAASLAPPAGFLGIAVVMQNWEPALRATFILGLQLLGINLGGAVIFRIYGLDSSFVRYDRGKKRLFYASTAVTLLALGGLLFWQFSGALRLQRRSESGQAALTVQQTINESQLAETVEVEAEFPRIGREEGSVLLVTAYVRPLQDVTVSDAVLTARLRSEITRRLVEQNPQLTPLVALTVVETVLPAPTPQQ